MDRSRQLVTTIEEERLRSLRYVQVVMGVMALMSLAAGLSVLRYCDDLGLPPDSGPGIAVAFMMVGFANTGLLFLWDRIFSRDATE